MGQQSAEIVTAECAQHLVAIPGHERVLAIGAGNDRLMKMPSGGEDIRKLRPAHERRVIAMSMADLLHGAANQHHVIGRLEPRRWLESEFALAWTEFDFDRSQ